MVASADRVQWSDVAVDSVAQASNRLVRSQVVPSQSPRYRLRFRANNSKSLTVPNAQIVSAAKTGTTTATIVTDVPHGLALGDLVTLPEDLRLLSMSARLLNVVQVVALPEEEDPNFMLAPVIDAPCAPSCNDVRASGWSRCRHGRRHNRPDASQEPASAADAS
jgi:hypothetical protein